MSVQSILFRTRYYSVASAKRWLREHGYKGLVVDTTENYHRFRQEDPEDFDPDSFRTVGFSKTIKAVVGRQLKKNPNRKNPAAMVAKLLPYVLPMIIEGGKREWAAFQRADRKTQEKKVRFYLMGAGAAGIPMQLGRSKIVDYLNTPNGIRMVNAALQVADDPKQQEKIIKKINSNPKGNPMVLPFASTLIYRPEYDYNWNKLPIQFNKNNYTFFTLKVNKSKNIVRLFPVNICGNHSSKPALEIDFELLFGMSLDDWNEFLLPDNIYYDHKEDSLSIHVEDDRYGTSHLDRISLDDWIPYDPVEGYTHIGGDHFLFGNEKRFFGIHNSILDILIYGGLLGEKQFHDNYIIQPIEANLKTSYGERRFLNLV